MSSEHWYAVLIAAVVVERIAELVVSQHNVTWALGQGGAETGRGHYPPMVALHTGLLAACGGVDPARLPADDEELWLVLATGVAAPRDELPEDQDVELLAAWYALEHAGWLCAVGELVRPALAHRQGTPTSPAMSPRRSWWTASS